ANGPGSSALEFLALEGFRAEGFDDAMAGECFGAEVGQLLERFLTSVRRTATPLAEPYERINDQRRAGQADDGQPGIVVEHQPHEPDEGKGFSSKVADRFRHDLLHLPHVITKS